MVDILPCLDAFFLLRCVPTMYACLVSFIHMYIWCAFLVCLLCMPIVYAYSVIPVLRACRACRVCLTCVPALWVLHAFSRCVSFARLVCLVCFARLVCLPCAPACHHLYTLYTSQVCLAYLPCVAAVVSAGAHHVEGVLQHPLHLCFNVCRQL